MTQGTQEIQGIPERIGRYRIVRPLSKGGMALVYEARRESLAGVSPRVAIKVILPDYAASATFRELFINEARLGAAMQHQNLVQIQDFDSDGERFFLVMEYVDGITLSRLIGVCARHNIRIPLGVICEVGRQACDGLHYAHQAVDTQGRALGLIHRDIKPSNLILNAQGNIKILDFGISKGALRTERDGSVKGTWGYMSPEQAMGARIGPNADIFGLGIVLYEMAARRSMFKGRGEDEIRRLLDDDHAARVASTLDSAYAPLVRVLIRGLQRDARTRFATAADFGRALADLLPDPITAREDTARFYREVHALYQGERGTPPPRPNAQDAPQRSSSSLALPDAPAASGRGAIALSVAAGLLVLVSVGVLAWAIVAASGADEAAATTVGQQITSQEPSDPAGPAGRPIPLGSVGELEGASSEPGQPEVDRALVRGVASAATVRGSQEEVIPRGFLQVSTAQPASIWVEGELLRGPQAQLLPYAPGRYRVRFMAEDGRIAEVNVVVADGEVTKGVYDFDKLSWR